MKITHPKCRESNAVRVWGNIKGGWGGQAQLEIIRGAIGPLPPHFLLHCLSNTLFQAFDVNT